MRIDLSRHHDFAAALVRLEATESFVSESSAMVHVDDSIDVAVRRQCLAHLPRTKRGLMAHVKRAFAARSLLLSSYRVTDGESGSVFLAPRGAATIRLVSLARDQAWLVRTSAFLGATGETRLVFDPEPTPSFEGVSGLLRASGPGTLAVWSETEIVPIQVRDQFTLPADQWIGMDECLAARADVPAHSPTLLHLAGVGQLFLQPHCQLTRDLSHSDRRPRNADPISSTRDR